MSQDDPDRHDFATPHLAASVMAHGAELCRLQNGAGLDYLWPAAPAWPRHAPVLFPIVGRLADDTLVHDGKSYRLTQHGFARDRRFTWIERSATGCLLRLEDDAETQAMYPFRFRFEVRYAVTDATLEITYTVINTGSAVLPASIGAHPAFRWPLDPTRAKEDYALTFDHDETAPLYGVESGLLTVTDRASPIAGRRLALNDGLFTADALILPNPDSRSVRLAAADGPALTVSWEGFDQLGIWSKPGADFVCIEPWCGMASPADFVGEFIRKPWLMLLPPGESHAAIHRMTVEA
ncbi:aldose 1-epimerase family protein [Lichenicola cladoniae]|uniref:Aldose 1-epimerase family protein n=1 Tax=Lichenicola cladoniae TaxID=1484109 RepID=A0A6M8HTJ2_9PROT|nr:aldose 1-epimerase family protein [Lichenicola cladoniae]NPD65403.1 aldose 1-epimerase family protein [Acetobacteraceae bacterium]QKE91521.1 aldose 1-epimerase family protein [Lichenicola cladoniae]